MSNPTPAQQAALDALRALPPKELFDLRDAFLDMVRAAEYPRLGVRLAHAEEDSYNGVIFTLPVEYLGDDDGEGIVDEDDLVAIDVSERWTYHPEADPTERYLHWEYGSSEDYHGLVYTWDGTYPVRLPEGWEER